jgi:hypothetical protein
MQFTGDPEAHDDVARFRLVLTALLPSVLEGVELRHDVAPSDKQFPSVLDTVKPAPRFALLLVGNVVS